MRDLLLGKSKTRDAILRLFFSLPDREHYLRELERLLGISVANIRRELVRLEKGGIFTSRRVGNQRHFSVNKSHPLFPEYRSIVFKTIGIAGALAAVLSDVPSVRVAFVFGSLARGSERPESDVDLMVIGRINSKRLHELIYPVRSRLGREINVVLFDPDDFRERFRREEHFIRSVMEGPREYVKGTESELRAITTSR